MATQGQGRIEHRFPAVLAKKMRRRDLIALLGCSAARRRGGVAVGGARAEAGAGHWNLGSESPELFASRLRAFRQGLSAAGYDEGRNVTIEYRWAEGHND